MMSLAPSKEELVRVRNREYKRQQMGRMTQQQHDEHNQKRREKTKEKTRENKKEKLKKKEPKKRHVKGRDPVQTLYEQSPKGSFYQDFFTRLDNRDGKYLVLRVSEFLSKNAPAKVLDLLIHKLSFNPVCQGLYIQVRAIKLFISDQ